MTHTSAHRPLIIWLLGCCGLVFTMVLVGAITRLTDSGLSIVEWKPLIGAIPPLSDESWQRVFDLYKQSPEFIKQNFWMELTDFKQIFFWEWFHRFLGRMIGLAYGVPLAIFWAKNMIPADYKKPLLGILLLGAAQGYMGWFMVKSGLVDNTDVSHYRLAAHLALAFLIFTCLLKTALSLGAFRIQRAPCPALRSHLMILACSYVLTVFWGAYTAGLDAGLLYNDTFPHMGDSLIPYDFNVYSPWFVNLFENHAGVQFAHRWLAMTTLALGLVYGFRAYKAGHLQGLSIAGALTFAIIIQVCLGVLTLFSGVNIVLAVMHQGTALLILAALVVNWHKHG